MPIYQYKCDQCQTSFERNHPMAAPPVRICPECGKEHVRKVFATGGILSNGRSVESNAPAVPPCGAGSCGTSMCGMG